LAGEDRVHEALGEASGSLGCLGWDACPGPGGLLYNIDGYPVGESRG